MGRHALPRRRVRRARLALPGLAILAGAASLLPGAPASFSDAIEHPAASWTAGTVSLTASSPAGTSLSMSDVRPGSRTLLCVDVAYTGNLAASVKLYATDYVDSDAVSGPGQLTDVIVMSIYQANSGSCTTGINSSTTVFTGTLDDFATTATSYGSGVGSWNPSAGGSVQAYQIGFLVRGDDAAQGDAAGVNLRWEAQST